MPWNSEGLFNETRETGAAEHIGDLGPPELVAHHILKQSDKPLLEKKEKGSFMKGFKEFQSHDEDKFH